MQRSWLYRGVVKSLLRDLEYLVRKADDFATHSVAPSPADDNNDPGSQSDDLYCQ
jgi:hypothetical protein